ncbi:MAG: transcriptional regulator [Polaromonas sp. 39-63-203]|uniref:helix-turn-helix domain-containing protein n=1 Tax=Polaromonas sp. TaxID=1869339 RepID=UPI000BDA4CCB|nr:helix-turn-helix domain-containing protein [Polaromonas sp.]OYY51717.1 MAG: transcriptional regulator [Polaromonas sp. 35-63-240]OYY99316.1 MAG: transcriptional regulator [Polaromonas sp. 28-63-22]OYZ83306.1 MAG: transcriptional regulator [Polaromonas sp. 24-62-144]OZA96610.1 MAG: transcriptional regulator [Polaromonas sp. 39-63-203]HQS33374.1 helix-turn-helix domain-containing protein [Polaromonas sp.]
MSFATLQVPVAPIRFVPIQPESGARAPTALKTHCSSCHLRELCLPCGLEPEDVTHLDHLGFGRRRVKSGSTLYHEGSSFKFIFAVRSGTFKSSLALSDGREQVSGFHVAGELMGLDGVAHGTHASSSIALEDSEICAIPYTQLTEMSEGSSSLQRSVSRLMSREIVREHTLMLLLGSMNADERLAAFLLNLSQRLKSLGYSASEFHLRMSRAEIGSYLGMTLETVSRTFSSFQQRHLMEVDKRHICITDMDGLKRTFETRMR